MCLNLFVLLKPISTYFKPIKNLFQTYLRVVGVAGSRLLRIRRNPHLTRGCQGGRTVPIGIHVRHLLNRLFKGLIDCIKMVTNIVYILKRG